MPIRQDRRRRLYTDDSPAAAGAVSIRPLGNDFEATGVSRSYTEEARQALDRAVSTLVPTGRLAIALTIGICLALVGTCLGLHAASSRLAATLSTSAASSLRLDAPASLGNWVASSLLLVAAAAALFIFSLRRYRIDDFHGRYRVWIWITLACGSASIIETANLGLLARALCHRAAELSGVRQDVLWPSAIATIGVAIGLRVFFEIRRCPSAVAALAASAASLMAAAVVRLDWTTEWSEPICTLLVRGGWLTGYVFVLATFLLYSRHVQLDSSGSLPMRSAGKRSKTRPSPANEPESTPAEPPAKPKLRLRTDLDPVEPAECKPVASTVTSSDAEAEDPPTIPANGSHPKAKLTRAERRRMRRETRMAS